MSTLAAVEFQLLSTCDSDAEREPSDSDIEDTSEFFGAKKERMSTRSEHFDSEARNKPSSRFKIEPPVSNAKSVPSGAKSGPSNSKPKIEPSRATSKPSDSKAKYERVIAKFEPSRATNKPSDSKAKQEPSTAKQEPSAAKHEPSKAKLAKQEPRNARHEPSRAKNEPSGGSKHEPTGAKHEPSAAKTVPSDSIIKSQLARAKTSGSKEKTQPFNVNNIKSNGSKSDVRNTSTATLLGWKPFDCTSSSSSCIPVQAP